MCTVSDRDDSYNGWANRETWAVALYINNDQGWQESVHEELRDASMLQTDEMTASKAGEIVRDNVEEMLELAPRDVAADIGSLWRVDWHRLGEVFLADVEEIDQ
ncbi:MAG: hypothetical protein KY440_03500 [Actinobacteria bacterium]|nr:hypothetical protein [Actinomycetota bacterium]